MLAIRGDPRRWPSGLRAAVCMGAPVLVGWLAGDLTAGLTATLGGFTALYGSGRLHRLGSGLAVGGDEPPRRTSAPNIP